MYLSKFQNIFCPNCKMYLSNFQNLVVQIAIAIGFLFSHKAWFPAGRSQLRLFEGRAQCARLSMSFSLLFVDHRQQKAAAKKCWMREQRNIECASEEILNAQGSEQSHTTRAHLERVSKSIGFGRLSKTNEPFPPSDYRWCHWQLEFAFWTFETSSWPRSPGSLV